MSKSYTFHLKYLTHVLICHFCFYFGKKKPYNSSLSNLSNIKDPVGSSNKVAHLLLAFTNTHLHKFCIEIINM